MCGIAGFIGTGDQSVLKSMTDSIAYRGPDAEGFYSDLSAGVFLGHRRLSIVDLSGGAQPMKDNSNQYIITFNGEIYNHQEIRKELIQKGHRFLTTNSDTETLIEAYKAWGEGMLDKLNGMFAFAIYDQNKKQLFIARDRFGKKPLFYSFQNGTFVFGSELHVLTKHPEIKIQQSKKALQKYFAYGYIPAPNSLYEKVYKLPGGHFLRFELASSTFQIKKWWSFKIEPFTTIPQNAEQVWGEELLDLLSKAIKRRLMSEVPLGFFLSGGIDSSSLVALASKIIPSNNINTFSIGFTEASFDESVYAKMIAEKYQTNHISEILDLEKALTILPNIVNRLDEPMGDASLLPTYLLCQLTRKHVTVALGGDGADELFCGYDPFKALEKAKLYNSLVPKPVHQAFSFLFGKLPVSHKNMSLDFKIKRTLRGLSYHSKYWNSVWMGPLAPSEVNDLFNEELDMEDLYSEAIAAWESCDQPSLLDKATEFYVKLYLQDDILVKVDRASMMNSLEVRAPFLDIDLVNFARKIPVNYRFKNGETKYILKKALEPILPHDILYRKKKGFGVPIGKWFSEGKLKISSTNNLASMLNSNFIKNQLGQHEQLKADNRAFLWNLYLLSNTKF
jgi:asparagine synthase (glutamine-hydrolysing)